MLRVGGQGARGHRMEVLCGAVSWEVNVVRAAGSSCGRQPCQGGVASPVNAGQSSWAPPGSTPRPWCACRPRRVAGAPGTEAAGRAEMGRDALGLPPRVPPAERPRMFALPGAWRKRGHPPPVL